MHALKPVRSEASTDMDSAPDAEIQAAERALAEGEAQRCRSLVEPLLAKNALDWRARALLAQALEALSEQHTAAGEHAQALALYQQFHKVVVEGLQLRLTRSDSQPDASQQDALTGLARREALELRLPPMMQQALAGNRGLCLVRMELDPLQPSRVALTPGLGDAVLREVGAIVRAHCRAKDLALRYSGESLVLVLSEVELSTARTVCERIRRAVQAHGWAPLHEELRVGVSLGMTALRSGDSISQLMARAEAGLISARRDGRNCVRTGVLS